MARKPAGANAPVTAQSIIKPIRADEIAREFRRLGVDKITPAACCWQLRTMAHVKSVFYENEHQARLRNARLEAARLLIAYCKERNLPRTGDYKALEALEQNLVLVRDLLLDRQWRTRAKDWHKAAVDLVSYSLVTLERIGESRLGTSRGSISVLFAEWALHRLGIRDTRQSDGRVSTSSIASIYAETRRRHADHYPSVFKPPVSAPPSELS